MRLNCIIYTTQDPHRLTKDLVKAKKFLSAATGREEVKFSVVRIPCPTPEIVLDKNGYHRISWDWFKHTFELPPGATARCFHFTPRERARFGVSKRLNGSYLNDQNDHVFDFWVCARPGARAKDYPYAQFLRVLLHELAHGDTQFLEGDQDDVHLADYRDHAIHAYFARLDYTSWNAAWRLYTIAREGLSKLKTMLWKD